MLVIGSHTNIALPHSDDTVLRVVTVHDRYTVSFHVIEVRCNQYREGGFPGSAFLR